MDTKNGKSVLLPGIYKVQVQVSTGTVSTSRYYERGDKQFFLCKDIQIPFSVWISSKESLSCIFIKVCKVCPVYTLSILSIASVSCICIPVWEVCPV
jgi:hypothetical protein